MMMTAPSAAHRSSAAVLILGSRMESGTSGSSKEEEC